MIEESNLKRTWPKSLRSLLTVLLLAYLPACSTTSTAPSPVLPSVRAEEACLAEAESLAPLTDPSLAGLARKIVQVAESYYALAERHRCLAEFERNRR